MAKTGRELRESVKLADLIIEVVDARIPKSSGNPDFDSLFSGRRRLVVLNKADLADPDRTGKWVDYYRSLGREAVTANSRSGEGLRRVRKLLIAEGEAKTEKQAARGVIGRPVRAIVAGIPNSGKSSLINSLAGKASAKTGDTPGVTKRRQWIRVENNIEMLDTPGVLWPKFENEEVSHNLAFTGAIRDDIYDITEVAEKLLSVLLIEYPLTLAGRYGEISAGGGAGAGERASTGVVVGVGECPLLEGVGRKRGFLLKGGLIDTERAAAIVLDEFRAAKIGRITLELP